MLQLRVWVEQVPLPDRATKGPTSDRKDEEKEEGKFGIVETAAAAAAGKREIGERKKNR